MGGKDGFFLQFFEHGEESKIVVGLNVLHPEDLDHIAGETVPDEQIFGVLNGIQLFH